MVERLDMHSVIEMNDHLILSLAMLVESRDNSTGEHVLRTKEGVRILTEEILKEGKIPVTKEFCRCLVKAAPLHDLGKISIDDAILRKPCGLTEKEFEIIKTHPTEGARVLHKILLKTDDEVFKTVAENVAHYHHEHWDGSGYPIGLKGEEIPLEARIMAIADVYDALVNNRFYKGALNFCDANDIIIRGMGTHFDPCLRSAYENARPRLEKYYSERKSIEQ
ncbi:MAG: HD domain-containing protein [Lachnospiraceae bacterium]|nr:HD domain-containing protein [Lachnospiraceae bacterium]